MKLILLFSSLLVLQAESSISSIFQQSAEQILDRIPKTLSHTKALLHPQDVETENTVKIYQGLIEQYLNNQSAIKLNSSSWLRFTPNLNKTYPHRLDWREVGAVSEVKQQGSCASDWAFGAVGAIEGQLFRKNGKLVELSVQNVLDCSKKFDNDGCAGGFIHKTFEYVEAAGGIDTESSYPYEGKDGACRFNQDNVGAKIKGYVYVAKGDEKALEAALATVGPIAVGLAINPSTMFTSYKDGIYFDPQCGNKPEDLTFGALLVGYGTEMDGRKYWLVKNSYGTKWGLDGYMKIAKDVNNHCGIATYASFPLV